MAIVTTDDALFHAAVGRMQKSMLWLGGAGAVVAGLLQGWQGGLGFLAGSIAALANFRWLHHLVVSLGPDAERPRKRIFLLLILRYALLGLGGYVIVKFFRLSLAAALLGLFVAVAAVLLEIAYEIIYARA